MKVQKIFKGAAAFMLSLVGLVPDNEQQAPLWTAIIITFIGLALIVLAGFAIYSQIY